MEKTESGEERAFVRLKTLKTLWFNTGSLCNLDCTNCYIDSSPRNDRLSYLNVEDVQKYLLEIKENKLATEMIGFTGGEPFLNPSIINLLKSSLDSGFKTLVLTNAYRVLHRHKNALLELNKEKLFIRVSLDHYTKDEHDKVRGEGSFEGTLESLKWLYENRFKISIASRSLLGESLEDCERGHEKLLSSLGIKLDLKENLVIFPEMKSGKKLPEISVSCWEKLGKRAEDQMCASERMIVKPKAYDHTRIMPCTLLAYDERFVCGEKLSESKNKIYLNHPFCAEFCVLGGASCSSTY